jgi:hypothetical protein
MLKIRPISRMVCFMGSGGVEIVGNVLSLAGVGFSSGTSDSTSSTVVGIFGIGVFALMGAFRSIERCEAVGCDALVEASLSSALVDSTVATMLRAPKIGSPVHKSIPSNFFLEHGSRFAEIKS